MKSCIYGVLLCIGTISLSTGCMGPPDRTAEITAATLTTDGVVTLPATGFGDPGVTTSPVPSGWAAGSVAWCCTTWWTPLTVAAGDVVGSVAAQVQDVAPSSLYIPGSQGDGGSSVVLSLVAQNGSTTTTLRTVSSNGSGSVQSLIMSLAQPYTVPAGTSLLLKADAFALWPSGVMHPSMVGPVTTRAPSPQSGTPDGTRTLSIPLAGPLVTTSAPIASMSLATSASTVVLPFSLPIGSTIVATRAVVSDNTTGPTRLKVGLLTIDGIGTGAASASDFGSSSAGTGAVQAVMSAPMTTTVQSGRWYAVEVVYASGTSATSVKAAEVNYTP